MILDDIVKRKIKEIEFTKERFPLIELNLKKSTRDFKKAISKKGINLIAEIKKASPSEGTIRRNFDIIKIAKEFKQSQVAAISVITEKNYFKGNVNYIKIIERHAKKIPVLRKDFIIDEYQIYESRYFGADACLLIASLLNEEEINNFIKVAKRYKMDCLVEVHNEAELNKVLNTDAEIIGINNRNLKNFKVDLQTTAKLIKKIPKKKVIVSESGFKARKDISRFKNKINAVLIGTSIMKSDNIKKKISELM